MRVALASRGQLTGVQMGSQVFRMEALTELPTQEASV